MTPPWPLAEGVGGTAENFVKLMNDQAKALGMKNTALQEPRGPDRARAYHHRTRPGSVLASAAHEGLPGVHALLRHQAVQLPGHTRRPTATTATPCCSATRRWMASRPATPPPPGYCLVATSKRDFPNVGQRRLLSIVLGAASENARANESQKLLNWGYTAFEAVKLFDAGQPVATPAVWKGTENTLKIGRAEAIVVAVPSGSGGKIKTEIARPDPLVAPFAKGQAVGSPEGGAGRADNWPRCLWWRSMAWRRPAFWAAPGMPSASG